MISVIIPVYNTENYLRNCVESVQRQTYSDLQILLIDDGSTDTSPSICDTLAAEDSRIQVIHQTNRGVSAARNAGLELAKGDYFAFVDSDDLLEPDIYETLLGLAMEFDADIAHCGYKRIQLDGTTKDIQGTGKLLPQDSEEAVECLLTGKYFVGSLWNKLYRRELFFNVRFDTSLKINEDVLANVQVFLQAKKLVFLDVPKYNYFERKGSSCVRTEQLRKSRDCVAASEKIRKICSGTRLEPICAKRLYSALTQLYRVCLLDGSSSAKVEQKEIHQRVCEVLPQCAKLSYRSRNNYRLMRIAPHFYRAVYPVYNRIRKPNWDL